MPAVSRSNGQSIDSSQAALSGGSRSAQPLWLLATIVLIAALSVVSLLIGVGDFSWQALLTPHGREHAWQLLLVSRVPRTVSLLLAGAALSVAGLIMQMIARNRFVEPSTAGTAESASLGILAVTLLAPGLPMFGKMLVASGFALAGTLLFLQILRRIPLRSVLIVPLVGMMLGGVVDSMTTFLAYRYQLLQSLAAWTTGDFSSVLQGRYELLWIAFGLTVCGYIAAARFTLAGMGEAFTTNLGLNYHRVVGLGLTLVSMITAVVVVTVGMIPFLGLVVPNLVAMVMGDNARRTIPWVAVSGAGFVLACDIMGRMIRYPYEIPVGTVAGVAGCGAFLFLLLKKNDRIG